MSSFLGNLWSSIFTPGPTPALVVATNASFAALQLVLFALLFLTYSIHFVVLSLLCAGLWLAINWFVTELQAANAKEKEAKQIRDWRKQRETGDSEGSGTETEAIESGGKTEHLHPRSDIDMPPEARDSALRKRRSLGSTSGDISTDSEWDKVEAEGDLDR